MLLRNGLVVALLILLLVYVRRSLKVPALGIPGIYSLIMMYFKSGSGLRSTRVYLKGTVSLCSYHWHGSVIFAGLLLLWERCSLLHNNKSKTRRSRSPERREKSAPLDYVEACSIIHGAEVDQDYLKYFAWVTRLGPNNIGSFRSARKHSCSSVACGFQMPKVNGQSVGIT